MLFDSGSSQSALNSHNSLCVTRYVIFKFFTSLQLARGSLGYFPLGVCACALPPVCSLKLAPLIISFIEAFGLCATPCYDSKKLHSAPEEPEITLGDSASSGSRCVACSSRRASPPKASSSVRSNKEGFELSFRPNVLSKSEAKADFKQGGGTRGGTENY